MRTPLSNDRLLPHVRYRWKIEHKSRESIQRVSNLDELQQTLCVLDLPGRRPPAWIIYAARAAERDGMTEYIHNEGGRDEWRLTWRRVQGRDWP
ncbi:hypothetical protein QO002_005917 [Pararhizobium capsulatum DSM 1112]|uniref:Uncharacterized protein n=1 Tax=Pararhizobium capsulatum DSM 1112 TaxID=1121113 RepID=A0ABU0BZP5_9HYPH|nr:hypothetical protein [Pararhizobium capsulatum DSM 1112]